MDGSEPVLHAFRISHHGESDRFGRQAKLLFALLHQARSANPPPVLPDSHPPWTDSCGVAELSVGVRHIFSGLAKTVAARLICCLPCLVVPGSRRTVLCGLAVAFTQAAKQRPVGTLRRDDRALPRLTRNWRRPGPRRCLQQNIHDWRQSCDRGGNRHPLPLAAVEPQRIDLDRHRSHLRFRTRTVAADRWQPQHKGRCMGCKCGLLHAGMAHRWNADFDAICLQIKTGSARSWHHHLLRRDQLWPLSDSYIVRNMVRPFFGRRLHEACRDSADQVRGRQCSCNPAGHPVKTIF
jgi:hypothetical protein